MYDTWQRRAVRVNPAPRTVHKFNPQSVCSHLSVIIIALWWWWILWVWHFMCSWRCIHSDMFLSEQKLFPWGKNESTPFKVIVAIIRTEWLRALSAATGEHPGQKTDNIMQCAAVEMMLERLKSFWKSFFVHPCCGIEFGKKYKYPWIHAAQDIPEAFTHGRQASSFGRGSVNGQKQNLHQLSKEDDHVVE